MEHIVHTGAESAWLDQALDLAAEVGDLDVENGMDLVGRRMDHMFEDALPLEGEREVGSREQAVEGGDGTLDEYEDYRCEL